MLCLRPCSIPRGVTKIAFPEPCSCPNKYGARMENKIKNLILRKFKYLAV
jgi:hypothetical protein